MSKGNSEERDDPSRDHLDYENHYLSLKPHHYVTPIVNSHWYNYQGTGWYHSDVWNRWYYITNTDTTLRISEWDFDPRLRLKQIIGAKVHAP